MPLDRSDRQAALNAGIAGRLLAEEFSPRWDDVRAPATAINPPGQVSDPDWDNTNIGWLFAAGGTEIIHVVMQFPHTYKEGSEVYPHIHWEPTDGNSGNVLWRLSYQWRNNGEAAGSFTDLDLVAAVGGTADTLQIDGWGPVSKDDAQISSIFECKLSRIGGDGSDTYGSDARLKEFDIHIQVDSIGSAQITAK